MRVREKILEAMKEVVFEIKGKKIAFLSFSCTLPLESGASEERPGIAPIHIKTAYQISYPERGGRAYYAEAILEEPGMQPVVRTTPVDEDLERIKKRIREVKETSDFVIVGIHWGLPYQEELCEYETPVGHAMINAGADVVVGHHAHRIHAVEVYREKPIFHSVGNFILYSKPRELLRGEALMLKIVIKGNKMEKVEPIPIKIDEAGYPFIAEGNDKTGIINLMQRLSSPLGTVINYNENEVTIRLNHH